MLHNPLAICENELMRSTTKAHIVLFLVMCFAMCYQFKCIMHRNIRNALCNSIVAYMFVATAYCCITTDSAHCWLMISLQIDSFVYSQSHFISSMHHLKWLQCAISQLLHMLTNGIEMRHVRNKLPCVWCYFASMHTMWYSYWDHLNNYNSQMAVELLPVYIWTPCIFSWAQYMFFCRWIAQARSSLNSLLSGRHF